MIEFNWSPFLHVCLLGCSAIQDLRGSRSWSMSVSSDRRMDCRRVAGSCGLTSLLNWTVAVERRILSRALRQSVATLSRRAELSFRAFDAMMKRSLPVRRALMLHKSLAGGRRRGWRRLYLNSRAGTNGVDGRPRRRCHSNAVGVVLEATLDSIARRKERVKSLNQIWMTGEELGDAGNDAGCVDAKYKSVAYYSGVERG